MSGVFFVALAIGFAVGFVFREFATALNRYRTPNAVPAFNPTEGDVCWFGHIPVPVKIVEIRQHTFSWRRIDRDGWHERTASIREWSDLRPCDVDGWMLAQREKAEAEEARRAARAEMRRAGVKV